MVIKSRINYLTWVMIFAVAVVLITSCSSKKNQAPAGGIAKGPVATNPIKSEGSDVGTAVIKESSPDPCEARDIEIRKQLSKPFHQGPINLTETDKGIINTCSKGGDCNQIDRRPLYFMNYLVQKLGHRIAVRIVDGYESTACSDGIRELPGSHLSSHNTGQAMDIYMIDDIPVSDQISSDQAKREAAQDKIRTLVVEILANALPDIANQYASGKVEEFRPTQIFIYNKKDVEDFASLSDQTWGAAGDRGNQGIMYSDKIPDHIHIGW